MGLSKIKLDGKGTQSISSFSFEKNVHGRRLANGFIHQFTKPVIHSTALHVTVSCLGDPDAGSSFPQGSNVPAGLNVRVRVSWTGEAV